MFMRWQLRKSLEENDDSEQLLPSQEKSIIHLQRQRSSSRRVSTLWYIIPGFFVAGSYIFLLVEYWKHGISKPCQLGTENIFNDIPIKYEYTRFKRAGFHDSRHDHNTIYEGSPNQENNAAWENLLSVGVVTISTEENARLTNGSALVAGSSDTYMVELEMFHQFHCLKWIRDQFWQLDAAVAGTGKLENIPQRRNHTDHCIDYLRQAIMCHGDVTPITFEYLPEINGLIAHHSTEHQCRNFESIYNWASARQVDGFQVGGNHKNVELKNAEKFD